MGKPSTTTHKPVWMFRSDDAGLARLKHLLGLRDNKAVSTPDAIGDAIRARVADLESDEVWVRMDRSGTTPDALEQEA